jgi:hypothetical protein
MKKHTEKTRAHLGELHALGAKTEAVERKILAAAEKRHAAVLRELDALRPGVEGAGEAKQDDYLALVRERGQLDVVIAKARQVLGG